MIKRGIVDLSSVIWTQLLGGRDTEHGKKVMHNGKDVLVNSAMFGYESALTFLVKVMDELSIPPRNLIFVEEGKNSKQNRQSIHPLYKAGRDKLEEQYVEFNLAKEQVLQTFLSLGAQAVKQDGGVEADDVIGHLALNLLGERWCISGDKDIAVLVNPAAGIHHYRAGVYDANPFGEFSHSLITTHIALVGDSGDKIPGAKGFAKGAFEMMMLAFGEPGLRMMEGLIQRRELLRLQEDVGELRELQRIIDDADGVYMSYDLARLQVEKVNTLRRPLQWRAGMVKPRDTIVDHRLRKFGGVNRIVSAETFDSACEWARNEILRSPYVSLDIETSTPPESDEWLESRDKADKVDVFGSELTSLQMTFGPNLQYTIYLPVDNVEEAGCTNVTIAQVAQFVDMVPRTMVTYVHNASFELPICFMSWGQLWSDDQEYHGFLRNVRDTLIGSSYVNENRSKGLKSLSKDLLGYEQATFDSVTTKQTLASDWDGVGKIISQQTELVDGEEGPLMYWVQYKMNQLKASEVLAYGADDTICTAALANHFQIIMEIEKTWDVYNDVETYPAYLTALAYVQGTDFSLESMREQEEDDDKAFAAAEPVLHDYLMKIGFEGTRFEPATELTPAEIKRACLAVTGHDLKTMVRTPSKLAKLIRQEVGDDGELLAALIDQGNLEQINALMEAKFMGKPDLDLASPKQMKALLYDFMRLPVHVINDITPLERQKDPVLDDTVKKFKAIRAGRSALMMTQDEMHIMRKKAKTDDTAIDFALAFDTAFIDDEARAALKAIGVMKKVMTRRSLFYNNYRRTLHWKDNKIHASANQCAAVTRRYSYSDQNLQQLPKKGEAVRFRSHFKPHKKNAIIASIDFIGQELRLAAERSQDANMLACYVGDNLKDIHSITAAGALRMKWGGDAVDKLFDGYGSDLKRNPEGTYQLFIRLRELGKSVPVGKKADDLRKDAKNVNFGAQNGAMGVKLSETLVMTLTDAQLFLDAREAMFPDVGVAANRAAEFAKTNGYVLTMLGARRHLQEAMLSDERGAADRAARQAWNFEIQGSAGEMTKLAMKRLWLSGVLFRLDCRFIAAIHDELVTSVMKSDAVEFLRIKHECIAHPYANMKVPVLGSISFGPDFADQHEVGDWFIQSRIESALNDIFAIKEAA